MFRLNQPVNYDQVVLTLARGQWRVTNVPYIAGTGEAAGDVVASRVRAARRLLALVHVFALGPCWLEAVSAGALTLNALSVIDAVEVGKALHAHVVLEIERR